MIFKCLSTSACGAGYECGLDISVLVLPLPLQPGGTEAEADGLRWRQGRVPLGAQPGTDAACDRPLFDAPTSAVLAWDPTGVAQSVHP